MRPIPDIQYSELRGGWEAAPGQLVLLHRERRFVTVRPRVHTASPARAAPREVWAPVSVVHFRSRLRRPCSQDQALRAAKDAGGNAKQVTTPRRLRSPRTLHAVGRGHVSRLTDLDNRHSKPSDTPLAPAERGESVERTDPPRHAPAI
jgi:hypothetical protein